ncbi:hypothetical protein ACFLY5_00010 [Patescibacteria group bacterium]
MEKEQATIEHAFTPEEAKIILDLKNKDPESFDLLLRKMTRIRTAISTGNVLAWKKIKNELEADLNNT